MARKPHTSPAGSDQGSHSEPPRETPTSDRDRIVDAFMAILAVRPIEDIGLSEIAARAEVSLSTLRKEFASKFAILAAHIKNVDRKVLEGHDAEMADEPARERLFDVLMRRIEILTPHKEAIRSLLRSARRDPCLALALNCDGGAIAAMDADGGRHQRVGPARHAARPGRGRAVRAGAADLRQGRRSRPCPHHGGARQRARPRRALGRDSSTGRAGWRARHCAFSAAARAGPRAATTWEIR